MATFGPFEIVKLRQATIFVVYHQILAFGSPLYDALVATCSLNVHVAQVLPTIKITAHSMYSVAGVTPGGAVRVISQRDVGAGERSTLRHVESAQ